MSCDTLFKYSLHCVFTMHRIVQYLYFVGVVKWGERLGWGIWGLTAVFNAFYVNKTLNIEEFVLYLLCRIALRGFE